MVGSIVMHWIKLFMVAMPGQPWSGHVHPPFYQLDALPARRPDGQALLSFPAKGLFLFDTSCAMATLWTARHAVGQHYYVSLPAEIFSFTHRVPNNGHSWGRCYLSNSSPLKILVALLPLPICCMQLVCPCAYRSRKRKLPLAGPRQKFKIALCSWLFAIPMCATHAP